MSAIGDLVTDGVSGKCNATSRVRLSVRPFVYTAFFEPNDL